MAKVNRFILKAVALVEGCFSTNTVKVYCSKLIMAKLKRKGCMILHSYGPDMVLQVIVKLSFTQTLISQIHLRI